MTPETTTAEALVWDVIETPIGPLTLQAGESGLRSLSFPGRALGLSESMRSPQALAGPSRQLEEYFAGARREFDLDLDLRGSELQRRVWSRLLEIPYGETTTYGEIGRSVAHENPRAIGGCVGRTPVPIIVPCHRVIAADGALRGYGGGLHRKASLLMLELRGANPAAPTPPWAREQLALV